MVILDAVVDEKGKVRVHRVVQGLPMGLTEAARETAEQWTFRPATLDGEPVASCYSLTINYQVQ
jgi:Gram-negative bacterial TonB protein C-terminal